MKKYIISAILLFSIALFSHAQTGTWSGKLDVQGTKISLVFHLDEENPTIDSPDQGARGISAKLERTATGIKVAVPSINANYEGVNMGDSVMGTFKQHGLSFPLRSWNRAGR